MSRKAYATDVSDEEWEFVAPYLPLLLEDATQLVHPLCELFEFVTGFSRSSSAGVKTVTITIDLVEDAINSLFEDRFIEP